MEEKAKLNSKYIQNWEGYKEYIFFEASSIRKIGDTYYIINLNLKNNFVWNTIPSHKINHYCIEL